MVSEDDQSRTLLHSTMRTTEKRQKAASSVKPHQMALTGRLASIEINGGRAADAFCMSQCTATKSHSPAASIGHQGDRCTPATGRSTGVAERLGPTMRASIGSHQLDSIPGSSEVRIHAEQNGNCARTVIEALIEWAEWAEMRRQILGDASTR